MKLIPEWRHCWKLSSVQLAALIALVNAAGASWCAFQGTMNPLAFACVNMGLSCAVAVARVVQQSELKGPPPGGPQ